MKFTCWTPTETIRSTLSFPDSFTVQKKNITAYRNGSIPCEQLEINTCYMLGLKFFDIWKSKKCQSIKVTKAPPVLIRTLVCNL